MTLSFLHLLIPEENFGDNWHMLYIRHQTADDGELVPGCGLQALEQMRRELRHKMEREISELQRRMWHDDDDVYFRELDAERVRRELRLARCQTRL